MEKLRKIMKWVGVDGLLHFLACFACMLTFMPIVGIWWAELITISLAVGKEVIDALRGTNNKEQMMHDFICDAVGMLAATCIIFLWWLCNL
jgi:hypothetical protein